MAIDGVYVDLMFLIALLVNSHSLDSKEFQKSLPAKVIWGVKGKDVELPCDVTPAVPGDRVSMVFWFKDTMGMPLYSLDARGGPLLQASHLAMSDDLGRRSYFLTDEKPSRARLRIQQVDKSDQGIFRCRVDFVNSPTRNFQVNLTLIEQPSTPRIFDAEGREVKLNISVGPFLEGHELFLSCQVNGGHPRPSLTWWYNNTILDSVVDSARGSQMTVNQLLIKSVGRHLKGGKLECRASSSEIAGDIVREVAINVFLKPNKVKIVTPNSLLPSGKSRSFKCETSGSYPPAKITWLLDGKSIMNADVTEEETNSFTGSVLSLTVSSDDDDKLLVCQADNPRFPGGSIQDTRKLSVAYSPRVSVALDPDILSPVREGTDVVLHCEASGKPEPQTFLWYHENHLVAYNQSQEIFPNQDILTIKNIKQNSAGQYSCSAKNSEGETYSSPFNLIVQYAPHCKRGYDDIQLGVIPYETIMAKCVVDSVPSVTRFFWTYNTSRDVLPVKGAQIRNKGNVSTLNFPTVMEDVRSLACYAENTVGRQMVPCLFRIVPAEPPEPPKNCLIRNSSHPGFEVSCIAGYDGGLHQSFLLEVSDISGPAPPGGEILPTFRVLGERPIFKLQNLQPNKEYQAMVYAENARGRSHPPFILPLIILKTDTSQENIQEDDFETVYAVTNNPSPSRPQGSISNRHLTIIIAGISVTAVLLIVVIVIIATVIACRRSSSRSTIVRKTRRNSKPPSELELSEAGFGEGFHRRSALYRASMYGECEERISRLIEGPDLILSPTSFSQHNSDY